MVQIYPLTIENYDFSPKELTLSQADEIEISIAGFTPQQTTYTICTEGYSFAISQGDKLRHKFLTPGEFLIKCKEYTWMTAKIFIVQDPVPIIDPLNTSQTISTGKSVKSQKKSNKHKRKNEKNFLKKLKNSEENLDEIFNLIVNIEKIVQDKKGILVRFI